MCFRLQNCIQTHSKKQFQEAFFRRCNQSREKQILKQSVTLGKNPTFDLVMHKRQMSPDFQYITISTAVFQAFSIVIYLVEQRRSEWKGQFLFLAKFTRPNNQYQQGPLSEFIVTPHAPPSLR